VALKITSRELDGVAVLALEGRIVLGEEASTLRANIEELLGGGKKNLLLNMNDVTLMDSTGLDTLVSAYSKAKAAGASLRLCNLRSRIVELLQTTKLVTVFEISDTEADAVRAMAKKASAD
jgi:anti-sigma B factor antagonist